MAIDLELQGKAAAVTGGSEGIGKAIALKLAMEGVSVAICARREEVLERAAEDIRARAGSMVLAVQADVTKPGAVETFIERTGEAFGRLDILVNNVGTSSAYPFEGATEEIWRGDFDLKVFSAIRAARAAIPIMRRGGGGRIVNITTPGGKAPGQASVPTSVSRAAGIALTKAMSKDFAREHILVNTVCVGAIKSGQWIRRWASEGRRESLEDFYRQCGKEVPLGRLGEAEEVADLVAFLVSARAAYITGTAINIDGGMADTI
jgi:NAD(P)-dependent dehydrogenase (short-subunit alcohol dehydrogenase family)